MVRHIGETFSWNYPRLKFLPGKRGIVRCPRFPEKIGGKGPGSIPAAARLSGTSSLIEGNLEV